MGPSGASVETFFEAFVGAFFETVLAAFFWATSGSFPCSAFNASCFAFGISLLLFGMSFLEVLDDLRCHVHTRRLLDPLEAR
jgi:hypothetical protein